MHSPISGPADWLSLAAAPVFAAMALVSAMHDGPADMLCAAMHPFAMSGMVPMYVLMSVFHSAPWLRLIARTGTTVRGPQA